MNSNIKKNIIRGSIYTGFAKYTSLGVNLIVTVFLSRILSPESFGIVALTTVVTSFFDILANAGMGPAIIQNKDISDLEITDLFSFSMVLSFVLCSIFCFLIIPIANFFSQSILCSVLACLIIQLFFTTINVVPNALMLKAKKFKQLSLISTFGALFWGGVAICSAFFGIGIYALVITPIGLSISNFLFCFIFCGIPIKFKFCFSLLPLRKILSFSLYQFFFNVINFFSRNFDKILLGKFLGMSSLGYYEKSYRLMTLPISTFTNVLTPSIQPVLSEYQDNQSLIRNAYNKFSLLLLIFGFVLSPFLFFCSEELIFLVFGSQWEASIPVFKILSISVPFQLVDSLSGCIFQSANKAKYLFKSGLLCTIINLSFLSIGLYLFKNLVIVSAFVSLSLILNFFISIYFINVHVLNQSINKYLKICIKHIPLLLIISSFLYVISYLQLSLFLLLIIKTVLVIILSFLYFKIRRVNLYLL